MDTHDHTLNSRLRVCTVDKLIENLSINVRVRRQLFLAQKNYRFSMID